MSEISLKPTKSEAVADQVAGSEADAKRVKLVWKALEICSFAESRP